jgi:hypothetical protein
MLLATNTLLWFGPGAASMGDASGIGEVVTASAVMTKRSGASFSGVGTANTLRPYRGRAFGITAGGVGSMISQSRKQNRFGLAVSIGGALTQDGVTGAVLESKVEGDLTLKQTLRILLAHAAGNATGLEGANPEFKAATDSAKTRISGTYSSGNRTVTTLDGS